MTGLTGPGGSVIKLTPENNNQVIAPGRDALAQNPVAAPTGNGVRPTLLTGATGLAANTNGNLTQSSTRAENGLVATGAFDQAAKDGAAKIAGIQSPNGLTGSGSGVGALDKLGSARMAPSDVLNAALNPYQSNNPLLKAVQGIPGIATQILPQVANAPMQMLQSGLAPIQSMLGGPGAVSPALTEMLSRANPSNGFDGGPTSMAVGGSDGTARGERVQQIAQSVVGKVPYAWGGGGADGPGRGISDGGGPADAAGDRHKVGFDCSGLAQYTWKQTFGETIPRTSEAQYAAGIPVSAAQAKAGDLVFPRYAFSGGGGPSHVQILMPGGQTVMEAPSSGQMVKISPLQAGSQFRTFAAHA